MLQIPALTELQDEVQIPGVLDDVEESASKTFEQAKEEKKERSAQGCCLPPEGGEKDPSGVDRQALLVGMTKAIWQAARTTRFLGREVIV